jgi:hypothetical protein
MKDYKTKNQLRSTTTGKTTISQWTNCMTGESKTWKDSLSLKLQITMIGFKHSIKTICRCISHNSISKWKMNPMKVKTQVRSMVMTLKTINNNNQYNNTPFNNSTKPNKTLLPIFQALFQDNIILTFLTITTHTTLIFHQVSTQWLMLKALKHKLKMMLIKIIKTIGLR